MYIMSDCVLEYVLCSLYHGTRIRYIAFMFNIFNLPFAKGYLNIDVSMSVVVS